MSWNEELLGGTPIFKLYGYVPHFRVWFLSCFSLFVFLVWNRVWLQIYGYRFSGSGLPGEELLKSQSCWSLRILSGLSLPLLKFLHNCKDHFHLYWAPQTYHSGTHSKGNGQSSCTCQQFSFWSLSSSIQWHLDDLRSLGSVSFLEEEEGLLHSSKGQMT